MGVVLDTSVLVDFERRGLSVRHATLKLEERFGPGLYLSAVTLAEFVRGIERAHSVVARQARVEFSADLEEILEIIPVDAAIGRLAGAWAGELDKAGMQVGLIDLLIGATAMLHDHQVLSFNVKHFSRMPGVRMASFDASR